MAMSRGNSTIKTIIVLVIMVLVGVLGVLGVNTIKTYTSGASADTAPKNVLAKPMIRTVGGGQESYAVITWTSDKPTMGTVEYGTTPASLLLRQLEREQTTDHNVEISPLKQGQNYYFRIKIVDEVFDNGGIPFSLKAKAVDGAESRAVDSVVPTVALVPTNAIIVVPTSGMGTNCLRTTDYNGDGTVNSLDFLYCIKNGSGVKTMVSVTPTASVSASGCDKMTDYNGDGVVNSLDYIKCLQTKK